MASSYPSPPPTPPPSQTLFSSPFSLSINLGTGQGDRKDNFIIAPKSPIIGPLAGPSKPQTPRPASLPPQVDQSGRAAEVAEPIAEKFRLASAPKEHSSWADPIDSHSTGRESGLAYFHSTIDWNPFVAPRCDWAEPRLMLPFAHGGHMIDGVFVFGADGLEKLKKQNPKSTTACAQSQTENQNLSRN